MTTAPRASTRGCCPMAKAPIVVDAGSSNGTFVNGVLVRERRIVRGDVVAIGANSFVFGREIPSARQLEQIARLAEQRAPAAPGEPTDILPESFPALQLHPAPAHLAEIVACRRGGGAAVGGRPRNPCSPSRSNSSRTPPSWTGSSVYRALAGLLAHLLETWPRAKAATRARRAPWRCGSGPTCRAADSRWS